MESAVAARASGRVPEIWGMVPQRNKNFTGREDVLRRLRAGVSTDVTAVVPHALHGFGGVGKTQVAIEYAYRYQSEYDVVWWISADQPHLVRSSLAALAPHLNLPPATATGIEKAATAVLDALRRGIPYDRWLLIFDNADQPEDINEIIPRGPGHVLITSRNHRWEAVVDTVLVDVFSRAESVDFMNKRVSKISAPDATQLAQELGDLPLALEQAGALQAETGMSVDEYLRLLKGQTSELLAASKSLEYPVSMTAAWKLSVDALNEQLPEAVQLLRCCAFFSAEPIPRDVFMRAVQGVQPQLTALLAKPILLTRAIRELGRFALARIDTVSRTIQVHRLIQALLREELSPLEQELFRHDTHLLLAAAAPKNPDDNVQWPRYDELAAHVGPSSELDACQEPAARRFALDIARYLYQSGDRQSSRGLLERLLDRWKADSGADHPDVLDAQWHLGNTLRDLGEYQAAYDLTRATLERSREILGSRDELTLVLMNSFGADLRAQGEFGAARDLDEQSRRLHDEFLGATDPRTLRTMNNLALDYGLNSDYQAARELHQRTYVQQNEAASGVSKSDLLTSWSGLSRAVRLCGEYAEARYLGDDAYEFGRQQLGAEYFRTLRTAKDLSIALRRTAAYDEALALARDVFERCTRLFGTDHPDTLAAAMSITNILRAVDRIDEAFELAKDTVNRYPTVYGADHPYNHGCAGNLALLLRLRGDLTSARQLNHASLTGLDARLTRDHHYPLTVATNLASDIAGLGDAAAARKLGEDTLVRLRSVLGENHPVALGCATNLAVDMRAHGAEEEASRLTEDTLERYNRTLGSGHPDTRVAQQGIRLNFDFDPPPI